MIQTNYLNYYIIKYYILYILLLINFMIRLYSYYFVSIYVVKYYIRAWRACRLLRKCFEGKKKKKKDHVLGRWCGLGCL